MFGLDWMVSAKFGLFWFDEVELTVIRKKKDILFIFKWTIYI